MANPARQLRFPASERERSGAATIESDWRPRAYRGLSRLLPPRGYVGKVLLVAFVGTHIPLAVLVVYLLGVSRFSPAEAFPLLLVALGATLLGSALTLLALRVLVAPVALASRALRQARLGGERLALPTNLEDEGGRLLAETQHTLDTLDAVIARLEQEAATDELTGMLNRRAGERRLRLALAAPHGERERLAVALLDVDGLKAVNDRWGHAAGDAALARLAAALSQHVGDHGWVARWGGDEFLVVLMEHDDGPAAGAVLMAVRKEIAAAPLPMVRAGERRLGISWGLSWPVPGEDLATVVERADAALYRAKQRSRGAASGR
ncbi:MAG: GGDEF domain-containing protein [Chloroflexia bacterium]|nr:GGDEF domain-containing protein [Chloroflexia bacterium]